MLELSEHLDMGGDKDGRRALTSKGAQETNAWKSLCVATDSAPGLASCGYPLVHFPSPSTLSNDRSLRKGTLSHTRVSPPQHPSCAR